MASSDLSPPFEAYSGSEDYIFVSYAHRDSFLIFPELSDLNDAGRRIWYDEGIDPGSEWPEEIANAITRCALFVVYLSPYAVASKNVCNEINFALGLDKNVLVIYLRDTEVRPGLKMMIGGCRTLYRYLLSEKEYLAQLQRDLDMFSAQEEGKGPDLMDDTPYGIPVEGRSGIVQSPFGGAQQLVDVRDLPVGSLVKCPYTNRSFLVPRTFEVQSTPAAADLSAHLGERQKDSPEQMREIGNLRMAKGQWEGAAMIFEDLLELGQPLVEYGPKLAVCLLSAHEVPLEGQVQRIEQILRKLESMGYWELAAPYRLQLMTKLHPVKRPWWQFW